LVDFNLHIPGNALLFFLMANLATAEVFIPIPLASSRRRRRQTEPVLAEIAH
jgi:hypothetical protein